MCQDFKWFFPLPHHFFNINLLALIFVTHSIDDFRFDLLSISLTILNKSKLLLLFWNKFPLVQVLHLNNLLMWAFHSFSILSSWISYFSVAGALLHFQLFPLLLFYVCLQNSSKFNGKLSVLIFLLIPTRSLVLTFVGIHSHVFRLHHRLKSSIKFYLESCS